MPRNPRFDAPGCLHHVMNRGIARRTVFETRADVRYFLSLLARAHRKGWIEVHAYAILATHFHLLVRSVDGQLSDAMRWVTNQYVRYFNRTRRRDGPLMRGRFKSKPINSWVYLRTVIRYIDENAIVAGLAPSPAAFKYGSARWLRQARRRPLWLSRDIVDEFLAEHVPHLDHTAAYDHVFSPRLTDGQRAWIERRLDGKADGFDELDSLLGSSARVLAWARRKAKLADGTRPGTVLVDPGSAMRAVVSSGDRWAELIARPRSGRKRPAMELMRVALLREAAGESYVNIARRLRLSPSTPKKQYRLHVESMEATDYAEAYAALVSGALRVLHGDVPLGRSG